MKIGRHGKAITGDGSTATTSAEAKLSVLDTWWQALYRCIFVQLVLSILMQVSYVAFPAYNFAIALWCLLCCTPKWFSKNPRLMLLVLGAVAVSILTDIIWISLWVSGRVFYDQFCGRGGVSIISCGGASDYFPGCTTNRFSLLALLLNDLAKVAAIVCVHRIHSLQGSHKKTTAEPVAAVTPIQVPQLPLPDASSVEVASPPKARSSRALQGNAADRQPQEGDA